MDMQANITRNGTCELQGDSARNFLVTELIIFALFFVVCTVIFIVYWILKRKHRVKDLEGKNPAVTSCTKTLRGRMRQLKSGDTIPGKILISVTLVCNLAYLGLAIARSLPPSTVERCASITDPEVIIELLLTLELIFFAFVRLLSSDNIVLFWFDPYSLVDIWTLPHIFITIGFGVDWLGLRYLRFIWLIHITAVLQFANIIRSQNIVDLIKLTIYFCDLWLVSSGILHLIESEGDFWKEETNQPHSVLTYTYFLMVTMSTVGYGDFSPVSDLGRTFIIFFILGGLAFFAAILPKIVEVVTDTYSRAQYSSFDTSRVPKHVIVCGHITAATVGDFLKDFLHPDQGDNETHVLLLHPKRPDEALRNVIRIYYTRVQYLVGSVLSGKDLNKAKINRASAVFVLTNKYSNNPKEEDNSNLLRVVSVKNTSSSTRCVIQLLRSFSKSQALSLQGWMVGHDLAVCIGELKMGMLAQSCLIPGFSTLVSNMFYTVDVRKVISLDDIEDELWKKGYAGGLANELYASTFSDFFKHKTFHEAAKICFEKLGLILLALEDVNDRSFYINPSPDIFPDLQIDLVNMWGYFVAQDQIQVSNVSVYCECCAGNKHDGGVKQARELRKKLHAARLQTTYQRTRSASVENITFLDMAAVSLANQVNTGLDGAVKLTNYEASGFSDTNLTYDGYTSKQNGKAKASISAIEEGGDLETGFGGTEFTSEPSLQEVESDSKELAVEDTDQSDEASSPQKRNVTFLVEEEGKDDRTGLHETVRNGRPAVLQPALSSDEKLVVAQDSSFASEMSSPLSTEDDSDDDGDEHLLSIDDRIQIHVNLHPVSFDKAVLNPSDVFTSITHAQPPRNIEGHIILCLFANDDSPLMSLYNFLKPLRRKHIRKENIKPVVIVCQKGYIEKEWPILSCIPEVYLVLGSPLRWTNLKLAKVTSCSVCVVVTAFPTSCGDEPAIDDKEAILCTLSIQKKIRKLGKNLHVITDLRHESNVQFLDFADEDKPDERIYKSEPYACGRAFCVSMFDSVTSSIFHNPGLLKLLEGLVNLSSTCRIAKIPISEKKYSGKKYYGEFYIEQLKDHNICLGLSRRLPSNLNRNFVITCPGKDLELEESDIAIIVTGQ